MIQDWDGLSGPTLSWIYVGYEFLQSFLCQDVAGFCMVVDAMQSAWCECGLSACGDVDQCVGDTLQLAGSSDDISFTDGCEAFTFTTRPGWNGCSSPN